MDKETLSNYGWVVIAVLVLSVMIALATPFGKYIATAVENTTEGLFDVQQKAMGVAGLVVDDQNFDGNSEGSGETPVDPDESQATIITFTIDGTTHQAKENMTLGEWVDSEYNTIGLYTFYDGLYVGDYVYISELYGEEPHITLQRVGGGLSLTTQTVIEQDDEYYLYDSIGEWLLNSFFTVDSHYFTFRVFPDSIVWADVLTSSYHWPWYMGTLTEDGDVVSNEEDELFANRIDWYVDGDAETIKNQDIIVLNYNYEDENPRECYLCYADGTHVKYKDSIKETSCGGDYILVEVN